LAKQNRSSKQIPDYDPILCPVVTLKAYEERNKNFRDLQSLKPKTRLFLSWIGKHNPVTSSSIARWLKQIMKDAGIDINYTLCEELPVLKQLEQVFQLSKYWRLWTGPQKAPSRSFIIEI